MTPKQHRCRSNHQHDQGPKSADTKTGQRGVASCKYHRAYPLGPKPRPSANTPAQHPAHSTAQAIPQQSRKANMQAGNSQQVPDACLSERFRDGRGHPASIGQ